MTQGTSPFDEVSGAILIGGHSRRLGHDKILLPYRGKPLILHLYGILDSIFARTFLVGHSRPEVQSMGLPCFPDLVPGKGVLGGIHTALTLASEPHVFIAAADMPFLTAALIGDLLACRHDADVVIPRGPKGAEPLCAVYAASCLAAIEGCVRRKELKVMDALDGLKVTFLDVHPGRDEPDPFFNINYPEDWERLKDST